MNLCVGIHPSIPSDFGFKTIFDPQRATVYTGNYEKVLIRLDEDCNMLPSFLNTFPCALISGQVALPYSDATVGSNVLQALDNMTSLHFTLKFSNCGPEFVKILTYLKEKGSVLNEISIGDEEN